ncbi:MAG TPA: hypothetical protein VGQ91_09645 [Ideonella sp.]|jgi:hypothetical protein|nr:hypothetical protein [Ideonella sp.]
MRTRFAIVTLIATASALYLGACGKVGDMVSEKVSEKATEKLIEAQINQDGGNAKVDLSQGGATVEGTDEKGKAFKMEMGSAQVSEQELGLPFYPGAKPIENKGTRIRNGELQMASVELASTAGAKQVAGWYREQMRPRGEGAMVIDSPREDNGLQLSIVDSKRNESLSVEVSAEGDGSVISLMRSSGGK